jgi:hypothetical protein
MLIFLRQVHFLALETLHNADQAIIEDKPGAFAFGLPLKEGKGATRGYSGPAKGTICIENGMYDRFVALMGSRLLRKQSFARRLSGECEKI